MTCRLFGVCDALKCSLNTHSKKNIFHIKCIFTLPRFFHHHLSLYLAFILFSENLANEKVRKIAGSR